MLIFCKYDFLAGTIWYFLMEKVCELDLNRIEKK